MIGFTIKFLFVAAVLVGVFRLGQAFALGEPDTITIDGATRYDDVAQTGDMLVIVEYTLLYDSLPTESISEGWLGRLIDQGGTGQLASLQPFGGADIPDLGYSSGVYGFYFAEEPTITGTLRITLEGNPILTPSPAGIFNESVVSSPASDLAGDLRAIALRLEDTWNIDLISPVSGGVNRYTEDGEHYFSSALPNLRNVAPDLFILQSTLVEPPDRTFDTDYTDAREALFDGTPIASGLESLGTALNVSEGVARFMVALTLAIVAAFFVGRLPGLQDLEFVSTMQIWVVYMVMMGGFWIGLVNAPTLGILTVLALMATAIVFFLQRTSA